MDAHGTLITLTERARSKVRDTIRTPGDGCGQHLRIAVVRTHCMGGRGFAYRLTLEDSPAGDDEVFEADGVSVCVDPASAVRLKGAAIDYVESTEGTGFRLDNPNAIGKCPCGHHDLCA